MRPALLLLLATTLTACAANASSLPPPSRSPVATGSQPPPTPEPTATLKGTLYDAVCSNNFLAALTGSPLGETHLSDGIQVTVGDGSNNILGVGRLKVDPKGECNYSFAVADIPIVPFYRVGFGTYPPLVFTQQELERKSWSLKLALDYKGDLGNLGSG